MFKKEEPRIEIFNGQSIEEIYKNMKAGLVAGNLRFLLDIDGTLSNFTSNPAEAFVDTYIVDLIYQLEKVSPGTVTFVTGRPKHEVLGLFQFSDRRDLFEVLYKETGRIPNMICNHGKAAFFGDETVEYRMTESQKIFLEAAKKEAYHQVIGFLEKSPLFDVFYTNDAGIKVKIRVEDEVKTGYLFEIKKDHHGELASFAFHWRVLQSLPEEQRKNAIDAFHAIVDQFGKEYNSHKQNPSIVVEGEPGKAPCPYFNLSKNSDCVAEFCPADAHLNKGSMVLRCVDKIRGNASKPLHIAMGDAVPGTDVGLLYTSIALGGLAFNVRHPNVEGSTEHRFTGTFHSAEEALNKPNQVNATVKFFKESGLLDICILQFAASEVERSLKQTPRSSYMPKL